MANPQHLAWLLEGVEAWYARREREGFRPDFQNADIHAAFEGVGALEDGRIPLARANLNGADFRGANLGRANFEAADLRVAKFAQADLTGANLAKSRLGKADLSRVKLANADLSGADLQNADFSGTELREVKLDGARINRALLRGADLRQVKLEGADLRQANLDGADLREAFLAEAKLERATLRQAKLERAELRDANLRSAILEGANLTNANCEGADFMGGNLAGANLAGANLKHANLDGMSLESTNLKGADMRGANFEAGSITRRDLKGTNLEGANLRGVNLEGTQLAGAKLNGTDFEWATLRGVDVITTYSHADPRLGDAPVRTDLSGARGLTQEQLDTMDGDTGVILPDGLHHPPHWPDPEPPEPSPEELSASVPADAPFIFLSYSAQDRDRIRQFHGFFSDQRLPIWWDQDIPAGGAWRETIATKLESASAVLTFWTDTSIQSFPVIEEASTAQSQRKLLHVRLDEAKLPYGFGETRYIDLRDWDGTDTHPGMAKLLQAMRDKLAPPPSETITRRLADASPVAFEPRNGKLTPLDTPPHVPPPVVNPLDLEVRLEGLFQTAQAMANAVDERRYNEPRDLGFCLRGIVALREYEALNWYALDDSRQTLLDCIDLNDGRACWPDLLVNQLDRLSRRIDEIEPLIRPRQTAPNEPGAKPPVPDPDLADRPAGAIEEIAEEAESAIASPEAGADLDSAAQDVLAREIRHLTDAIAMRSTTPEEQDRRSSRIRRALRGLAMMSAALCATLYTVGTDVAAQLLTSNEAALVLMSRFQSVLDKILPFFQ